MIRSFKHKGLKKFFETGSTAGIDAKQAKKIALRLSVLDLAKVIDDVDLPGFFLHLLTGARNGQWSVTVTGNWRITFELVEGDVYIVNYEDYH
ncbi:MULTISPECIES: type II toxin-antitoxin system RelE/ParE family toxin [Serratia]|uniref:type II toxin-antitoxin system RelE/ParE family toxin n=1 Tax=Serratia TaxID=613 RepID=UPI0018D7B584|nr:MULTISPECIES: type II toxin-antitoxin system RelE/ParE family toxin [Serratia]MBH2655930.1 type II toxin-antitoxin system RelE/ParE family toxin [Serratia ureilytica]MBH2884208.1 type II toxin-antitoxin system RelE/ParE family toxin [Serratia ureilytica]MDP8634091.1 type II toxin-antitoxin system RelE/ParE family toxin [Serratia marcescens]MDP8867591.1 type II toxin-antitoxin system RelE/ParE family toxin [Serratia marcescens]